MSPNQIPAGALTHLNYAFGYIKPDTFDIVTMDDLSASGFSSVVSLKTSYPGLKVWISLGGWTFNDNDTIWQPVFHNLASNAGNRAKFAKAVINFMVQYGFDGNNFRSLNLSLHKLTAILGVDLDWEYPGAPDRGGKPEDTQSGSRKVKLFILQGFTNIC